MRGSSSAPTSRVLDVVELLSQPGGPPKRFSDIVRELELTQATAHSILKTLSDRGWVTRDSDSKVFTLGPALSLVAARIDTARPLAHLARDAALRLVETIGMPVSVVERAGDELVITAFERPANSTITVTPNERIPYAPPFGVAYAAWDSAEAQKDWIERGAVGDDELSRRLRDVLAHTRERGYDIDWMTPALAQAAHVIGNLAAQTIPVAMRSVIDRLRVEFASAGLVVDDSTAGAQTVATISAPVLDAAGRTSLIVGVHPLQPSTIREVETIAGSLLAEAGAVQSEHLAETRP